MHACEQVGLKTELRCSPDLQCPRPQYSGFLVLGHVPCCCPSAITNSKALSCHTRSFSSFDYGVVNSIINHIGGSSLQFQERQGSN